MGRPRLLAILTLLSAPSAVAAQDAPKPPVAVEATGLKPPEPPTIVVVPMRLDDPPEHLAPVEPAIRWRVTYDGGYGLRTDDPWAASVAAAIGAREAELEACGEGATVRSMALLLDFWGSGRLERVRVTSEPAPDDDSRACVEDVLDGLDLRWGIGDVQTFRLELAFDEGPTPGTWARVISPDVLPPRVPRPLPWMWRGP